MFKITRKNIVTSVIGLVFTIFALFIFYQREWIFLDPTKYCDLAPHEVGLTEEFIKASFTDERPFNKLVGHQEGKKDVTFLDLFVGLKKYITEIDTLNMTSGSFSPRYGPDLLDEYNSRFSYRELFPQNFEQYVDTTLGVYKDLPKTSLKRQLAIVVFVDHGNEKINGAPIQPAIDYILAKDNGYSLDQFTFGNGCKVYRKRKKYEIEYTVGLVPHILKLSERGVCWNFIYMIHYGYSNQSYLNNLYKSHVHQSKKTSKKGMLTHDWVGQKDGKILTKKRIVNTYSSRYIFWPFVEPPIKYQAFIPPKYFPRGVTKCELYAQLKRWREGGWMGKFLTMIAD